MKVFYPFLLLLYLFAPLAWGNYSYFHFDPKKFSINDVTFNRYIKPQLKSIVREYYQMLKRIDPIQGDLIDIKDAAEKAQTSWRTWEKNCLYVQGLPCSQNLRQIYSYVTQLEKKILSVQSKKIDLSKDELTSHDTKQKLDLDKHLTELGNKTYQILHRLEEMMITIETSYFPYTSQDLSFRSLLHSARLKSEMVMTSRLDKKYKDEFDFIWVNYIKRIEDFALEDSGKDYLMSNLENLNISWNSFHVKMAKSDRSVSSRELQTITTMHQRWNSILKVILRR